MKSELYLTIKRIAIFCIVATTGLTIGGGFLCHHVFYYEKYSGLQRGAAVGVLVFGGIVLVLSVVMTIIFHKKYIKQLELDKELMENEEE